MRRNSTREQRRQTGQNPTPQQLDQIRADAKRTGKRALFRWCIRWGIMVPVIIWYFPQYPVLWWTLLMLVPLGLFSLYTALMLPRRVAARCDEIERNLRDEA